MPRNAVDYEDDFYAWTVEQARLLRSGEFSELDIENIAEELESMGRSDKREIESRLSVLLAHLLKWQLQVGLRSRSWSGTIREQREHIEEACRRKGLADDNRRLHHELQLANQRLQELLEETSHDGKPRLVPSPSRERLGQRWVGSEVTGLSSRPLKGGDGD